MHKTIRCTGSARALPASCIGIKKKDSLFVNGEKNPSIYGPFLTGKEIFKTYFFGMVCLPCFGCKALGFECFKVVLSGWLRGKCRNTHIRVAGSKPLFEPGWGKTSVTISSFLSLIRKFFHQYPAGEKSTACPRIPQKI